MFGSHLSIAGGMHNALEEARRLGLSCVQVFTKNQQQWKVKPLEASAVDDWRGRVAEMGWDRGGPDGRGVTVSHASYLINLASVNDDLWGKSIDLMIEELTRCETLGIPYLVHHPGSFVGADLETGIARIVDSYAAIFAATEGYRTVSCLEGTVGAGSHIGGRFEHLATLRERIAEKTGEPARVGFCLDTCHLHAAGYDMSTRAGAREVLASFDGLCGLSNLKVWHLNDSKGKLASRLDRHEHIGEGWVGGGARPHTGEGEFSEEALRASGFAEICARPEFFNTPKIMETPKDGRAPSGAPKGEPFDVTNLARLLSLVPGSKGLRPMPTRPEPAAGPRPAERAPARSKARKPAADTKKPARSARSAGPKKVAGRGASGVRKSRKGGR